MAAIVTGCLGAVGGKVGELILRQFNYLYCFRANITKLKHEADKLNSAQGVVISGEVETWLQKSNEIKREIDGILNEVPNVGSGCFSLGARFSLSKRAEETTGRLKELLDEYRFDTNPISQQRPPASMPIPSEMSYDFNSRKNIEDGIMATLRDGDVNMMGICGMGGLGKTTMAKRIMNRALEEGVFEEVVMAVVSQPIDKLKIQLEIRGSLGLKLTKEDETSESARVQKLHERLSGTKRTLVVLDDVWETLKLEDLGIPCGYKGCTTLLTSRHHDVLSAMNVQIVGMELLSEVDSWFLFKEKVGTHADDTELNSIAKEVVNECGGLPIALITVGSALKDKVNVSSWKTALRQLKRQDPDIPDFIKKVYSPLKLSYDALESKYKSVFLLCCLYPEDADIPLERLTYFCMGLRLFEGGMVEERDRMHSLTDVLKDRSLLLDSNKGDDYVRMHDVVRDVGIFIARKNNYISGGDSSLQRYKSDSRYGLLQIRNSDEEINFDGITDLYVLSIERCSQLTSLPFTQRPNNLITLVLDSCEGLETLSVVGELVNLEILICRDCDLIEELPLEINELNRLKVLELTGCENLQRIGRGIISSLVGLEELKMLKSFNKWEAEDREEGKNAGLKELGQLTKLRCLEIEIEDLALAAENIRLSSEVDRFTIRFLYESRWFSEFDIYLSNKKMCLKWEGASCLGDWIKVWLLRDTECLSLVGNGANEALGLTNLGKKIRYLELRECESMKKVVTSSMDERGATVFPSIEYLNLFDLPKLEEICDDRISSNSFQNLKILKLNDLPVLKQLWKSSQNDLGKDFLPQLEDLYIGNCGMMETVFLWKGEDGNENTSCHHITKIFSKLKKLWLYNLPNLISLCQGIEGIEFPLLKRIRIEECKKMKGMVWNEKISGGSSNNASIQALFFPQEVSFGCLKKLDTDRNSFSELEELKIIGCQSILSLFTSSMAGNLVNLKELWISDCDDMVEVIKDDEEKGMSGGCQTALLFPKLQTILLWNLPKLVRFCESKGIESIQFPVLRRMEIRRCGKMKGMVANGVTSNENNSGGSSTNAADIIHLFCESQQVSFYELEKLKIDGCRGILSLFTSSMAGNLVNLKELEISECYEMVEVIKDYEEKGMSGGQSALLFPKLQKLELSRLPKLVSFCESKGIESIQFPVLRSMDIRRCKKMKGMTANGVTSNENNSGGSSTNAAGIIHLFCQSKQVSFGCLKELEYDRNPFCSHTIHLSIFDRLEVLNINGYKGSMSFFSSSITGNLVNLTRLDIKWCHKMVKVIEEKEEEKEKVVSGAQRTTILFPKLHKIELFGLHEMVRFCEWKCEVELPSLTEVEINRCHNMQSFTLGPLNTPKLESVKINWKEVGGVKDLNDILQQQYINQTEEKQAEEAEKKKGGEEEHERKGETEEEQN